MKPLMKISAYLAIGIFFIIFFLPKVNLYYKLETMLQEYKITLSQEYVEDSGVALHVKDALLYYDDLAVAQIHTIALRPLLLYNSLDIASFVLHEDMAQFLPTQIDGISAHYSIIDPLHVNISSEGQFGTLEGSIGLFDRNISLHLIPSALLEKQNPFWLRRLKKDSEGGYRYESAY